MIYKPKGNVMAVRPANAFSFLLVSLICMCIGLTGAIGQVADDRSVTGGAQTLEDILARQQGKKIDDQFRRGALGNPEVAKDITSQLGTLGGVSNSEIFRALRYGQSSITVSSAGPADDVIIQDGGMRWLQLRRGALAEYGGNLLIVTLIVLVVFYAMRGKIRIDGGLTGVKIVRFSALERFGHWLLAGSFILLGLTGLLTLFGRTVIIPLIGRDAFAPVALASKWIHNNVAWAFMLGLIIVLPVLDHREFPEPPRLQVAASGRRAVFQRGAPSCPEIQRRPEDHLLDRHHLRCFDIGVGTVTAVPVRTANVCLDVPSSERNRHSAGHWYGNLAGGTHPA